MESTHGSRPVPTKNQQGCGHAKRLGKTMFGKLRGRISSAGAFWNFQKRGIEVREEQPKHGKVIEINHDEEASIRSATKDDPEKKRRTMGTAKSLREFEQMDWIPIDFGRMFDKARPHPNQRGMAKVIAEDFPPDNHTGYTFGNESAGDIFGNFLKKKRKRLTWTKCWRSKRSWK